MLSAEMAFVEFAVIFQRDAWPHGGEVLGGRAGTHTSDIQSPGCQALSASNTPPWLPVTRTSSQGLGAAPEG